MQRDAIPIYYTKGINAFSPPLRLWTMLNWSKTLYEAYQVLVSMEAVVTREGIDRARGISVKMIDITYRIER